MTTYHWEKKESAGSWVDFAGTPTVANPSEDFSAGTWDVRVTVSDGVSSDTKTRLAYVVSSAAPSYTGPLDLVPGATVIGAYSFRPLSTAMVGQPVVRLQRVQDAAELDFVGYETAAEFISAVSAWLSAYIVTDVTIVNGGSGYPASQNVFVNFDGSATGLGGAICEVDGSGVVVSIVSFDPVFYLSVPSNPVSTTSTDTGTGLTVNLTLAPFTADWITIKAYDQSGSDYTINNSSSSSVLDLGNGLPAFGGFNTGAFTNSFAGGALTVLYVGKEIGWLIYQDSPGQQRATGYLGYNASRDPAFDISDEGGTQVTWEDADEISNDIHLFENTVNVNGSQVKLFVDGVDTGLAVIDGSARAIDAMPVASLTPFEPSDPVHQEFILLAGSPDVTAAVADMKDWYSTP